MVIIVAETTQTKWIKRLSTLIGQEFKFTDPPIIVVVDVSLLDSR